jgi:hypothetical protein
LNRPFMASQKKKIGLKVGHVRHTSCDVTVAGSY